MKNNIKLPKFLRKKKRNIIILTMITLGLGFTHFYAPRFIVEIRNPIFEFMGVNTKPKQGIDKKIQEGKAKKVRFKSFDDTKLVAYYSYATSSEIKGTIIFLHGIRASKDRFQKLSEKLNNIGFHTVALDLRAHGESEGSFCTYGYYEKKDIVTLLDYLESHENLNNFGIWGQSLGGAVALQSLRIDKRLKFGIIESTFTNFRQIAHDYSSYYLGFNISFFSDYMINRAGEIANFPPDAVNPAEDCKFIEQPVLMLHGDKDKKVDKKYAKRNFKNLKSKNKKLWLVKNGKHDNIWKTAGNEYLEKTINFINTISFGEE